MSKGPKPDPHAPLNLSLNSVKQSLTNHLIFSIGKDPITATERDWFFTLANVVRDRLIERWMETMRRYYNHDAKRVYYLSMEFLIGRSLMNSVLNIGFIEEVPSRPASTRASIWTRSRNWNSMLHWATAAWAAWRRVSSIPWRPSACPATAWASATNTACSTRKSRTAGRWSTRTTGCAMAIPWEFPAPRSALPGQVRRPGGGILRRRRQDLPPLGRYRRSDGDGL